VTTASDDAARPVPVRVVMPADPVFGYPEQKVVARLWRRRQTAAGWLYLVGLPSYRDLEDGGVEAAEYRVWVRAPDHVRPVEGVDYDQVATEHLAPAPASVVREVLGEPRPSGWVLAKVRAGRGPARSVLHAPGVRRAHGVFELTWDGNGRATWSYGEETVRGVPHVIWRRIGTHDILTGP
jgi:hypothetical protein